MAGQNFPAAEYRECQKCKFSTSESLSDCPRCGTALQTETQIRSHGQLLYVMGGILTAMLAVITVSVGALIGYRLLVPARSEFATPVSPAIAAVAFAFLLSLLIFGVATVYAGRYQHQNGRRHPTAMRNAMWALAAGLLVTGLCKALG